jgi:predicted ATPase
VDEVGHAQTYTFLFTDVEGSTSLWQADGTAMAEQLATHDAVLAEIVTTCGGRVFKHTGDGMCAVFASARSAVNAALAAQARLTLPVRMGLHTGEAEARDGDYFGMTLNRCARIMDAGHGGQVLLSSITRALVDDVDCRDLGDHRLKGLAHPEHIFQLGHAEFAALRVPEVAATMPVALSSTIGRDTLVGEVVDLLSSHRLVTLTGVGGVGKTRVAVLVVEQCASAFDLVTFVDLTELSDASGLLATLGRAMGLTTPSLDSLATALLERQALLVIDNCEHVIDALADLVEVLLSSSPALTVLATSREGLAIDGERLVAVPALAVDDGAAELFATRARNVDPRFDLERHRHAVEEICRRLDGLPLAIELAAARIAVLDPDALLARLDERFDVLTGGRRRRSRDRQRTLRETVAWSYQLLDDEEQEAFARWSVFAGTFDLAGAAAVLGVGAARDAAAAMDLVEALVSKSLLVAVELEGLHRYRYLETIRAYAEEQLRERGNEAETVARLHTHLAHVVTDSVDELMVRSTRGADWLRVEIPNLRRAFDDALDRGDVDAAVDLIGPFTELRGEVDWHIAGWAREARALVVDDDDPNLPALDALSGLDAWLDGRFRGLHDVAVRLLGENVAGCRFATGVADVAAFLLYLTGDDNGVVAVEARLAATGARRRRGTSAEYGYLVQLIPSRGTGTDSPEVTQAIAMLLGSDLRSAWPRGHFLAALQAYVRCDDDEMLAHARAAKALHVPGAANWFSAVQLEAWALARLGRLHDALAAAEEDLDYAYARGDRSAMILPLTVCAYVLQLVGQVEAAGTIRGRLPRRLTVMLVQELADLDRWLSEQLTDERRAELAIRGSAMEPRELHALACSVIG